MAEPRKLSRIDWIKTAFRVLTREGLDAVRVERLAITLGVTKGSFYWHFKGLSDLKQEMILHWQQVATEDVIARLEALDLPLEALLQALLSDVSPEAAVDYGGPSAEVSIRLWARKDERVDEIVRAVDARRLAFLEGHFTDAGHSKERAKLKASAFYAMLIGVGMRPDPHISSQQVREEILGLFLT